MFHRIWETLRVVVVGEVIPKKVLTAVAVVTTTTDEPAEVTAMTDVEVTTAVEEVAVEVTVIPMEEEEDVVMNPVVILDGAM